MTADKFLEELLSCISSKLKIHIGGYSGYVEKNVLRRETKIREDNSLRGHISVLYRVIREPGETVAHSGEYSDFPKCYVIAESIVDFYFKVFPPQVSVFYSLEFPGYTEHSESFEIVLPGCSFSAQKEFPFGNTYVIEQWIEDCTRRFVANNRYVWGVFSILTFSRVIDEIKEIYVDATLCEGLKKVGCLAQVTSFDKIKKPDYQELVLNLRILGARNFSAEAVFKLFPLRIYENYSQRTIQLLSVRVGRSSQNLVALYGFPTMLSLKYIYKYGAPTFYEYQSMGIANLLLPFLVSYIKGYVISDRREPC